ncbi:MAG: transketolase family protein [Ignavibacteriales bacterium]
MNYEEFLKRLVQDDERIVIMTAENRAAIRNLPEALGDRFIDTGITEQALIGAAAGLALRGRIPIVHALATFLTLRAFEFIRSDIGIGNLPVKLVGGVAGFLSEANGPTHQAIEDISLMRGIPSVNIFCPADEEDLLICLRKIIEHPSPFYIRYTNQKPVAEHSPEFTIGKAELIADGSEIAILVYGILFNQAFEAAKILEENGHSVRLINLRTLKPVDEDMIIKAVKETTMLVTLEDHFITGGLYSIVCEIMVKNQLMKTVLPIALENRWFKPVLMHDLLEFEGFTGKKIAGRIMEKLKPAVTGTTDPENHFDILEIKPGVR